MTASNQMIAYTYCPSGCKNHCPINRIFMVSLFVVRLFYAQSRYVHILYIILHRIIVLVCAVTISYQHKQLHINANRHIQSINRGDQANGSNSGKSNKTGRKRKKREDSAHKTSVICFVRIIYGRARGVSVKPSTVATRRSQRLKHGIYCILYPLCAIFSGFRGCFSRFWMPGAPERLVALPSAHLNCSLHVAP